MSGLFSTPKAPDVQQVIQEAPKTPVVDENKKLIDEQARKAKKKGRASTVIMQNDASRVSKTLLGK